MVVYNFKKIAEVLTAKDFARLHLPANRWPPQLRLGVCELRLGVSWLRLAPVSTGVRFGVSKFYLSHFESARGFLFHTMACDSHMTFRAFSNPSSLEHNFTSILARSFDNLWRSTVPVTDYLCKSPVSAKPGFCACGSQQDPAPDP